MKSHLRIALLVVSLVAIFGVAACSSGAAPEIAMAPIETLPPAVQVAETRTREAYQFAVANPAAVQNVPCYCGCVGLGHRSNHDCYVKGSQADGSPVFDGHALNCLVCVNIIQDVMRLSRAGESPEQIRRFIVSNYSRFGPPTE